MKIYKEEETKKKAVEDPKIIMNIFNKLANGEKKEEEIEVKKLRANFSKKIKTFGSKMYSDKDSNEMKIDNFSQEKIEMGNSSDSFIDFEIDEKKIELLKTDKFLNYSKKKICVINEFKDYLFEKYLTSQKMLFFLIFFISTIQTLFIIGMNSYLTNFIFIIIFRIFYVLLLSVGLYLIINFFREKNNFFKIYKISAIFFYIYGLMAAVSILTNFKEPIYEVHLSGLLEMLFIYFAVTNLKLNFILFVLILNLKKKIYLGF